MAKIWSSLFGKSPQPDEARMTLSDLANQVFTYQGLNYPIHSSGGYQKELESTEHDYEGYVETAYKANGIVFACMVARSRLFSEARFQWQKIRQGRPGDLFGTPELSIFENPWPGAGTIDLLNRAIMHADVEGNHYAVRESNRIRVLRPDWVHIILTAPPDEAVASDVAGYQYRPGGTNDRSKWVHYLAGDSRFAHWAPTLDPLSQYRGMSWLTPVIREVLADKAATRHKAKFFDNAATPAMAVSFKETVSAEQFKEFMAMMKQNHQGADKAYGTLYLGGGADVTPLTHDMKVLDFKNVQGAGETRIAMAARVHPVILGASEGMQGASLNAGNFKAAKDAWADGEMRPLWSSLCSAYSNLTRVPSGARLWYDDRDVAFLRDDILQRAQVMEQESEMLASLIMQGFEPESCVAAVSNKGDWSLLKHTGLISVQLLPPGTVAAPPGGAAGGSQQPKPGQKPNPKPQQSKPQAAGQQATQQQKPRNTGAKRGNEAGPEEEGTRQEGGTSGQEGGTGQEA